MKNYSKLQLNDIISYLPQEPYLFNNSLVSNITLLDDIKNIDETRLQECFKVSCISNFINKLPNKYDSFVGENGVKLSGGQKQRISIARAIIKNSSIILLDEATSSLDTESERIVQNAINNLIKNKTTIVIAHRLSTIHSSDKIIVFKNGSVIDTGNHENLLRNCEEYKSLYQNQLK